MRCPFFTIIIPTKNSSQTLTRAIESILSQTFADFELLVCDGASTDNTVALVNSIADERLRAVSKQDQGIYDAMNSGITMARGEWLYFMGSDDYLWDQEVLTDVFQYIKDVNPDFVYGNVFSPDLGEIYDGEFDIQKLYRRNICHQAVFCKRGIFDKVGMFDTRFRVLGDYDFTVRCFHDASILKGYFDRRIAYYAPNGASRKMNRVLLLKERYRLAATFSKCDLNQSRVEGFYEGLADQLIGTIGARNFLLGRAGAVMKEFVTYDSALRRRVRRVILNRLLSRLRR